MSLSVIQGQPNLTLVLIELCFLEIAPKKDTRIKESYQVDIKQHVFSMMGNASVIQVSQQ